MYFDLASGSSISADTAICNPEGGLDFPFTWQSHHNLREQAEMPDQDCMKDSSDLHIARMPQQPQTQYRDPFRLLPNAAFEQQPDARLLAAGYKGQAAESQQSQQTNASTLTHNSQQHQENAALIQYGSWQAQTHSVQGMLASMQQRPAWVAPSIQGNCSRLHGTPVQLALFCQEVLAGVDAVCAFSRP